MFRIEPLIRLLICLMVLISGSLLGISLSNYNLVVITLVAGISGYLITDRYHRLQLDGILANVASILILIIAMRDFLPEDSSGKLVAVANLLIYLQALLMFQEKTPRLVWQILTLSLLQVVVAAIFSLNLEGGLLFGAYFLVAGMVLTLQLFFKNNGEIARINRASAMLALDEAAGRNPPAALIFFDPEVRSAKSLKPLIKHLSIWFLIALSFTIVMFYMIPRNTVPWVGGAPVEIAAVSPSDSVDLLNRGVIQQSNQLIFRAQFERLKESQPFLPVEPPYFRGISLSQLIIKDGHTNWSVPNDRVFGESYQELWYVGSGLNQIKQTIIAEENRHPIVYSVMPVYSSPETDENIEYCQEISALTRGKLNAPLDLAPYRYELITAVDETGRWLESRPYFANQIVFSILSMKADPAQEAFLTEHHPERYPTIVNLGRQIVTDLQTAKAKPTRLEICRAMEEYFVTPGRFTYTLDYRRIQRNDQLDPNEDFMRNHRSGHCEMFASALTLMLRSQKIPARLVVGFHGGDQNQLSEGLMVRARHAHAWVEAYLPPEECSPEMVANGAASEGGAWLRLDPTPLSEAQSNVGVGTEAIELARSLWQDYILGLNAEMTQSDSSLVNSQLVSFFQLLQLDGWERAVFNVDSALSSKSFRYTMISLIVLPPLLTWLFAAYLNFRKASKTKQKSTSEFRKWLASAFALISPNLGRWVLGGLGTRGRDTGFYDRLIEILSKRGIEREPQQSQRDFAKSVAQQFAAHSQASLISSVVYEVSEIFNEVRFGNRPIPTDLLEQVDQCLNELENGLGAT
jgi:protein-glutamine gamma-glutamyltransferase